MLRMNRMAFIGVKLNWLVCLLSEEEWTLGGGHWRGGFGTIPRELILPAGRVFPAHPRSVSGAERKGDKLQPHASCRSSQPPHIWSELHAHNLALHQRTPFFHRIYG